MELAAEALVAVLEVVAVEKLQVVLELLPHPGTIHAVTLGGRPGVVARIRGTDGRPKAGTNGDVIDVDGADAGASRSSRPWEDRQCPALSLRQ